MAYTKIVKESCANFRYIPIKERDAIGFLSIERMEHPRS